MSISSASALQHEWITLQTQYDSYEKFSLVIKMLNVMLTCLLLWVWHAGNWTFLVTTILWLQDGIWKTFQSRIALRLGVVEQAIAKGQNEQAMQFNTAWLDARRSAIGLLKEYIGQSCKPTVAFPHVVLLAMNVLFVCVA